jgi:hypothetical protein
MTLLDFYLSFTFHLSTFVASERLLSNVPLPEKLAGKAYEASQPRIYLCPRRANKDTASFLL